MTTREVPHVAGRTLARSSGDGRNGSGRLGVRPADFVERTTEEEEAIRRALRALYRDHLERAGDDVDCNDPTKKEEER